MFIVEQTYDIKTMTALNRAARKTVRRWYTWLRGVVWVMFLVLVGTFVLSLAYGVYYADDWIIPAGAAVMALFLAFDDRLNGWISMRRLFPGTAHSTTVFSEEDYVVTTETIETKYNYENIAHLYERGDYFFFFLGGRYGQIFDKRCFQTGTPEEFRNFIERKTGLTFETV